MGRDRSTPDPSGSLLALPATRRLIIGWTLVYGLGSWVLEYLYAQIGPLRGLSFAAAGKNAVYAAVWAPLLVGAVWLTDRWPVRAPLDWRRLLIHTSAITAAPFLWGTAAYYLCLAVVPGWQPWGVWRMYLKTAFGVLYVFAVLIGICHVAQWIRRNRDREIAAIRAAEAATDAQLHVLSRELHPHFLRNALNSISSLIYIDPARAVDALRGVRAMLQHAVRTASVSEVTVREEIATLEHYTRIQQLRFGDRLAIVWDVAPDVADAAVPNFLLQPLVENAIKFSVESTSRFHTVRVSASRQEATLRLTITDDGVGPGEHPRLRADGNPPGAGRGLANVRERLSKLYGPRHRLTLAPTLGGHGAILEVQLPFRLLHVRAHDAA